MPVGAPSPARPTSAIRCRWRRCSRGWSASSAASTSCSTTLECRGLERDRPGDGRLGRDVAYQRLVAVPRGQGLRAAHARTRGWARIVATASVSASFADSANVGYAATKAAVIGLVKALAVDRARPGVRVQRRLTRGDLDASDDGGARRRKRTAVRWSHSRSGGSANRTISPRRLPSGSRVMKRPTSPGRTSSSTEASPGVALLPPAPLR